MGEQDLPMGIETVPAEPTICPGTARIACPKAGSLYLPERSVSTDAAVDETIRVPDRLIRRRYLPFSGPGMSIATIGARVRNRRTCPNSGLPCDNDSLFTGPV